MDEVFQGVPNPQSFSLAIKGLRGEGERAGVGRALLRVACYAHTQLPAEDEPKGVAAVSAETAAKHLETLLPGKPKETAKLPWAAILAAILKALFDIFGPMTPEHAVKKGKAKSHDKDEAE